MSQSTGNPSDDGATRSSSSTLLGLFDPPSSPPTSPTQTPNPDDPSGHPTPNIMNRSSLEEKQSLDEVSSSARAYGPPSSPGSFDHISRLFAPPPAFASKSKPSYGSTSPTSPSTNTPKQQGHVSTSTNIPSLSVPSFSLLEKPNRVERQTTERSSNRSTSGDSYDQDDNDDNHHHNNNNESTPLLSTASENDRQMLMTMTTPKTTPLTRKQQQQQQNGDDHSAATTSYVGSASFNNNSVMYQTHTRMPSVAMPAIHETKVHTMDGPTAPIVGGGLHNSSGESSGDDGLQSQDPTTGGTTLPVSVINSIIKPCLRNVSNSLTVPTTYVGSFMYTLYHVVFCLALGSAIMRPSSPSTSILGLMTKTAALGTVMASPIYWTRLSSQIPALYPTADLFLAPFLAHLAIDIDGILSKDLTVDENMSQYEIDAIFLSTFGALTAIATTLSATLLIAASIFKLANLGLFLPFPVICGFFAAVGIMTWNLAVSIDTGGKHIGAILMGGDIDLVLFTLLHHIPTICVAVLMKFSGPKNPFFVPAIIFGTIGICYLYMGITGTSLAEMEKAGWMWSHDDLVYNSHDSTAATVGFENWAPPAPFGVWRQFNKIHWGAVKNGLSDAVAVSFLYLIRCSVHGAALKKNIPNLVCKVRINDDMASMEEDGEHDGPRSPVLPGRRPKHSKMFSEAVDIEAVMNSGASLSGKNDNGQSAATNEAKYRLVHAKPSNVTLKEISATYGWSQVVVVLSGGFPVTPSVAASSTMYGLGAGGLAPQIGSVILLLIFYLTDFRVVQFVPKPAFSSMLVLAAIDMCWTWAYKSWFKVRDKFEWMVVPAIVVSAFTLDLLSAVFLGIAFSTFIFVAAFFRSGVVKYVSNGQCLHSTIERPFLMSDWLDENGSAIQVIVLQNYLFFGNATSVYNYIQSIFDAAKKRGGGGKENEKQSAHNVTTKYLLLDLTLVTGMDTSAVDVFQDIRNLCQSNNCKLFVAGMSPNLRSTLSLGGFKPGSGVRSKRQLRFFANLDSALGKAEDMLLDSDFHDDEHFPQQPITLRGSHRRMLSRSDNGFRAALRHIDAEHGDNFSFQLVGLQEYTTLVELQPGERLYEDGASEHLKRGLSFIESGVLKLEHSKGATATRGSLRSRRGAARNGNGGATYGTSSSSSSTNDLSGVLYGDTLKRIKDLTLPMNNGGADSQTFRVARIGPGWVVGTLEVVSGMTSPGSKVAVSHCRLHHLEFDKIKEIEEKNPMLVLALYRLLSYLMARRQEATIAQLANLHTIMSSPGGNGKNTWRSNSTAKNQ